MYHGWAVIVCVEQLSSYKPFKLADRRDSNLTEQKEAENRQQAAFA